MQAELDSEVLLTDESIQSAEVLLLEFSDKLNKIKQLKKKIRAINLLTNILEKSSIAQNSKDAVEVEECHYACYNSLISIFEGDTSLEFEQKVEIINIFLDSEDRLCQPGNYMCRAITDLARDYLSHLTKPEDNPNYLCAPELDLNTNFISK